RVGKIPGLYPDPLLPDLPTKLDAGGFQSYWVDLAIAKNAKPGDYSTDLKVVATEDGQPVKETVTLKAKVYPVTVGKSRLWVTNWYSQPPGDPKTNDPKFWKELEVYGRSMASHRQNMAYVSPFTYTDIRPDGSFDFSVFDKWVETMEKAGVIGRIEGGHLGGRIGGWTTQFNINILELKDGKTTQRAVDPTSPEADAFYSKFLPALVEDLKSHHWLGIYTQHIADEPIDENAKTYIAMRDLIRKYAPELKVMDANHSSKLAGAIDLWVPQLNYFCDSYPFYQEQQKQGAELWFYTCVYPQGEYANRFIELPLIKTRLLHWMNFKYGATGYLHWGWNRWSMMEPKTPYEQVVYSNKNGDWLPAGDCFIVYPGKDGSIVDSIRWESMRDGIADYELLSMLANKDPAKAHALADRLILGFTSYVIDPAVFRQVRHELLTDLSRP
ncbi:MAG TPA: DUF4091 domain-containing protein, partial [Fimbriimonadaceae bacterium]|nr:DUF4091 domain-containing protein [Fimbriimonadaceae bacterium]